MKNRIYQLMPSATDWTKQFSMSYIITTDDGQLIVIDGGWDNDAETLLFYLKKISGRECPHIAAWFLSHVHDDHIQAFIEIISHRKDKINIGKVYFNFPSVQNIEMFELSGAALIKNFYSLLPQFADKATIVSINECYIVGNAKFDVLLPPDTAITDNFINNSSVVIRMTLGGKTVIFLGDLGAEGGRRLLKIWGDKLKSDVCQMAHHGQAGVDIDVYRAILPEICLWPTPDWLWNNDRYGKGFDTDVFQTVTTRRWIDQLGCTNKNYIMKDGTAEIELPETEL
mgnify:FL=1